MSTDKQSSKAPELHIAGKVLRFLYGGIFLISGLIKLADIGAFHSVLEKLYIFPSPVLHPLSYAVPVVEIFLSVCIIGNLRGMAAIKATIFLLTVFSGILITKLSEGTVFSCGCFGDLSSGTVDSFTIFRNIAFIIVGVCIIGIQGAVNSPLRTVKREGKHKTPFIAIAEETGLTLASLGYPLLIAFLLSQTIMLAAQNRILKERVQILIGSDNLLETGNSVPSFTAIAQNGMADTIAYNGSPSTLLFIMKTSCSPCKKNIPIWTELSATLRGKNIRVRGVMLDSPEAAMLYIRENKIGFSVLSSPDQRFKYDYKVSVTPLTILVTNGVVDAVWKGYLDTQQQKHILDAVTRRI